MILSTPICSYSLQTARLPEDPFDDHHRFAHHKFLAGYVKEQAMAESALGHENLTYAPVRTRVTIRTPMRRGSWGGGYGGCE
jgi:hypothetical protein